MDRVNYVNKGVNQLLRKLCGELNIDKKITWSAARSSFIATMVDAGYLIMQICEMIGNSPATIHKL